MIANQENWLDDYFNLMQHRLLRYFDGRGDVELRGDMVVKKKSFFSFMN